MQVVLTSPFVFRLTAIAALANVAKETEAEDIAAETEMVLLLKVGLTPLRF